MRVSNPASNPELLHELGKRFTDYKYDFKKLVRDICLSRTYQLSTQANDSNAGDTRNFSHAGLRRIKAETFLDCISEATNTKNKFPGLPLGARAVQIADGGVSTYFLTTFGRATRETVCSCEVKLEPTLVAVAAPAQRRHDDAEDPGRQPDRPAAGRGQDAAADHRGVVPALPEPQADGAGGERLNELVFAEPDKKKALDDAFWALLNSREFMFNH